MKMRIPYESPEWELILFAAEESFLQSGGYNNPIEDDPSAPLF